MQSIGGGTGNLFDMPPWEYWGGDFTKMPGIGCLWFLRCLFIFDVLSKVIVFFVQRTGLLGVGFWVAIHLLLSSTSSSTVHGLAKYGFSTLGMVMFSLGIYVRVNGFRFVNALNDSMASLALLV